MRAAVLRIFSGLHIGAEIELTEGVYVIGTDDSCDLILSDSSLKARHAALRVSVSGEVDEKELFVNVVKVYRYRLSGCGADSRKGFSRQQRVYE